MDDLSDDDKAPVVTAPTPHDFDMYLPWACAQLKIDATLAITKIFSQDKSNLGSAKGKKGRSKHDIVKHDFIDSDKDSMKSLDGFKFIDHPENTVKISTVYDFLGNLTQLKFDKNKTIPQQVMKLIGLIINYHKYLTYIVINSGIDNGCLYELKKWLMVANVTDVCLDNTSLLNYDLILEEGNKLKYLSISRCKIDDDIVNKIAMNIKHPRPASQTLLVLNLATNFITDKGAQYLAEALRTNRQLVYLNIADNSVTDEGAAEIFSVLTDFCVTNEEMISCRYRQVQYLKEKNTLVNQIAQELKYVDLEKKKSKKKLVKPMTVLPPSIPNKKGNEKDLKAAADRSITDFETIDPIWIEKAKLIAVERIGQLNEAFSVENVYEENGQVYCYGNNRMAYINISYNNVGFITVKKILTVLLKQHYRNRTPKGLVNLSLEGNFIPVRCRELEQIDSILMIGGHTGRRTTIYKLKK